MKKLFVNLANASLKSIALVALGVSMVILFFIFILRSVFKLNY